MNARRLVLWGLLLITWFVPRAFAQATNLTVRLYTLHAEKRVRLSARAGTLKWKTCETCLSHDAPELTVEAGDESLRIAGVAVANPPPKTVLIEGDYRIEPSEGLRVTAAFPLQIKAGHSDLTLLLSVPLEDYVAAALAGESGSFEQAESMKAMAVAIRTYAVRFRPRHQNAGFDFCDNTHCQTLNFAGIGAKARAAAQATRGEMLWYDSLPAATFYHQNCGGSVASAAETWPDLKAPYLSAHQDPYCVRGSPLPWKAQLDRRRFEKALRDQGLAVPEGWNTVTVASRTPSGRAQKLAFRLSSGNPWMVSASSVRFAIGRAFGWNEVRSDLYELETTPGSVIFSGRGGGHGVGLCQAGAEEMARQGKSYREILSFYYPGTALGKTAANGLQWKKRESDLVEFLSTQPEADEEAFTLAGKILPALQSELGWALEFKPQIRVYPSLDAFRNSTGRPGWVAAFTRGRIVSLQPLATLRSRSGVEPTLRHELAHLLIEARAHARTPLWFREGLVLYFADHTSHEPVTMNEAAMEAAFEHPEDRQRVERAYAAARTRVEKMVRENGKERVLEWLKQGLR